jgi:hypothetical protein
MANSVCRSPLRSLGRTRAEFKGAIQQSILSFLAKPKPERQTLQALKEVAKAAVEAAVAAEQEELDVEDDDGDDHDDGEGGPPSDDEDEHHDDGGVEDAVNENTLE